MSLNQTNANPGPLKPTLASARTPRGPLTPRVTATVGNGLRSAVSTPVVAIRSLPVKTTSRIRPQDQTAPNIVLNSNGRSRSRPRRSHGDSVVSAPLSLASAATSTPPALQYNNRPTASPDVSISGFRAAHGPQPKVYTSRPTSMINGESAVTNPGTRSTIHPRSLEKSSSNNFFHASDAKKMEPVKKPVVAKTPAFFYADGKQEQRSKVDTSPTLQGTAQVSEQRGLIMRTNPEDVLTGGRPPASPVVNLLQTNSSYFTSHFPTLPLARSPSPSKENIHLSYRKGASQIFGTRPGPKSTLSAADIHTALSTNGNPSGVGQQPQNRAPHHRKLSSSSSIDSGRSEHSRRLTNPISEMKSDTNEDLLRRPAELFQPKQEVQTLLTTGQIAPINTSSERSSEECLLPTEPFSPTKGTPDMAVEARRERKVLDLEISNSSLLAINASLEREVRRQKAELKRFRRLSRAGRLSAFYDESHARLSGELSTLDEHDDLNEADDGLPHGLADPDDDLSDAESESMALGESFSPDVGDKRERDRLARDEKRLHVDLQRHRELLVQSQMMNQSIRRCIYATEEMISGGKKALEYRVRVSDIQLGGRILTGHEDEEYEEIEIEDEHDDDDDQHLYAEAAGQEQDGRMGLLDTNDFSPTDRTDLESAHGLLQVWQNIGRQSLESGEAGDRDSGIEIDKPGGFAI